MQGAAPTRTVSVKEGYRRWSDSYDSQPNPMLSLEQRYVDKLLPEIRGRDVVDLGCGTGRWLEKLASRSPRSITGVDSSPSMLARAAAKLRENAELIEGDCERPCLKSNSADLVLCSFVPSYVSSIDQLATQIRWIARPHADIFVTDVHPETARKLGWNRGFRDGESRIQFQTRFRDVRSIVAAFRKRGLVPVALLEMPFGEPELAILKNAGKSHLIQEFRHYPAIYIIQFKTHGPEYQRGEIQSIPAGIQTLRNARISIGPTESFCGHCEIHDGQIASIQSASFNGTYPDAKHCAIDLSGFLLMPGLINAHDHLEFALFPRLGSRRYTNFREWAEDIYKPDASPVREHRAVPKETRLWWGAIRNLLSGVTTVCHHNPYAADIFENGFPVRVICEFGWAHSTAIDRDFHAMHDATPPHYPFIMHVGEGVDRDTAEELAELDRRGVLNERTVIVHGLALTDTSEISLINSRGTALIWCPTSNDFLFGSTHCREHLEAFSRVALGSDSSLTASGDLLDEIRFARQKIDVSSENLYYQVTSGATEILRLQRGQGHIRVGAVADFIAVRDKDLSPAETLGSISYRNVEVVVIGGQVHLASEAAAERIAPECLNGMERLAIDGEVRWLRAPVAKLLETASQVLGTDLRMNGRRLGRDFAA